MAAGSDIPFYVYFERELPEGGVAFSDNPPEVFDGTYAKPVAVDASGTPLPVQPLMQWDPYGSGFTVLDSSGAPTSFDPPPYQFPDQYWVHIEASGTPGTGPVSYQPIAVDASGTPLPTQPLIELDPADPTNLTKAFLHDSSGNLQPWPYKIPEDYSVHIAVSGSPGKGAPSYEAVAVDSTGTPLVIQPNLQLDPADPTKVTVLDMHGSPTAYEPPIYELSRDFLVHIEVNGTPGIGGPSYAPVAVDESGTPLKIQPLMEIDPADPTKVTIYNTSGEPTGFHPPIYAVPTTYLVHLETTGIPGHGTLSYIPIAVDSSGTPLTIQPTLELDPADPTKVTAYGLDGSPTRYQPDIYDFPERFTVHLGVSGPPGQGPPTYAPVAVDEFGTPLPIQPLMEVDPADPTNITVYDHTGTPTGFQPPIYFDKALAPYKIESESGGLDETDLDEEEAAAADDATVAEPDPEAHLAEASETAPEVAADSTEQADPISGAEASPSRKSETSQPGENDAGVQPTQGEAHQDSDLNEDLITAGLDDSAGRGFSVSRTPEPAEADMEPIDPSEVADVEVAAVESLVTAGLDEVTPETGAVDVEVETPTASPDLIPENDLTAAAADESLAANPDEAGLPIPTALPISVEETPDQAGTVTAEAIEEAAFLETMSEMELSEVEDATIAPIEVRIEVPESELGQVAAEIEEPVERLEAVEEDNEDEEQGRLQT